MIVLSACSLSSIEVLGRDLMANRAWSRRAKRLPMTCWNGALRSATGLASIGVSSDDLLVIATRAPTSDDRDVAASHERWVRGRFVGDSKVPPNFERAYGGDVQRGMVARTKGIGAGDSGRRRKENDWRGLDDVICCAKFGWGGWLVSANPNEPIVGRKRPTAFV